MADVKIFADYIEESAISQVKRIAESPAFQGETIRIMPDAHAGSGCVVGFTSTFENGCIIPAVVGVDIGCGVLAVETTMKASEKTYKKLDRVIDSYVPTGIEHFDEPDEKTLATVGKELTFALDSEAAMLAARSMGTLGGGNHFIELDQHPETNRLWLTVHTGSRNLGLQIARHTTRTSQRRAQGTWRGILPTSTCATSPSRSSSRRTTDGPSWRPFETTWDSALCPRWNRCTTTSTWSTG